MSDIFNSIFGGIQQGHMTATEMQARIEEARRLMQLQQVRIMGGLIPPNQVQSATMDPTPVPEVYTGPLRVIDKVRRSCVVPHNVGKNLDTAKVLTDNITPSERNIRAVCASLEATLSMAEGVDEMEMLPVHLRQDELKDFVYYVRQLDHMYRQLETASESLRIELKATYEKYVRLKGATYSEPKKGEAAPPPSGQSLREWADTQRDFAEIERRAYRQEVAQAERDQRAEFEARRVSMAQKANQYAKSLSAKIRGR